MILDSARPSSMEESHDMNQRFNKTVIGSVVFLDIVDYSEQPDSVQIALKERFKMLLGEVLKGVAQDDRIMLDTGDGAAIALLGAPEEALFVALAIHDGILKDNQHQANALAVRIGVNLGPVRVVADVNGRPNILGDAINVAQRVMSFAEPNQILASRTYYEIVSRISSETLSLFSYSGIKTDKHVREHEVYAIRTADGVAASQAATVAEQRQLSHRKLAAAGTLMLTAAAVVWLLWAKMPPQSMSMPVSAAPSTSLSATHKEEAIAEPEAIPPTSPAPIHPDRVGAKPAGKESKILEQEKQAQDSGSDKPEREASSETHTQPAGSEPQKPEQEKQVQGSGLEKLGLDKLKQLKQYLPQGQKAPCGDSERALGQCQ